MTRCYGCMGEIPDGYQVCPQCGYIAGTSAKEPHHLLPGTVLNGRYTIGLSVADDGTEVTYIALDAGNGKTVAVGEYFPHSIAYRADGTADITPESSDADAFTSGLDSFVTAGYKSMGNQSSAREVTVRDIFYHNGTAYMVSEAVPDGTLSGMLTAGSKPATKHGGMPMWLKVVIPCVAALLLIAASVLTLVLTNEDRDYVMVDSVIGQPEERATEILNELGFDVEINSEYYTDSTKGLVIRQNISGAKFKKGTTITLVVSDGSNPNEFKPFVMENYVGRTFEEVSAELVQKGVTASENPVVSDKAVGTILSQSPAEGTNVDSKDIVIVFDVCTSNTISIPDVKGLDENSARNQIESIGGKVSVAYEETDDKNVGKVIKQSSVGEQSYGTTVTLTVGKAKKKDDKKKEKCTVCGSTAHKEHPKCPTCGSTAHATHPAEVKKCTTCGSTEHTVHPQEKCAVCGTTAHTTAGHPKCSTCGSTAHTVHPQEKCATCGSTAHTTANHPAETKKCSTCGSAAHTVHPKEKCAVCGTTAHTTDKHPKCATCGSTAHTVHPQEKCTICQSTAHTTAGHPKCPECGDTDHTVHPANMCKYCGTTAHTTAGHPKCSICGSIDHSKVTHPKCQTCGSTAHTKHPADATTECKHCGDPGHTTEEHGKK